VAAYIMVIMQSQGQGNLANKGNSNELIP